MKIRLLAALITSLVTTGLIAEESKSDIAEILPATSMTGSNVNKDNKNENVNKQDVAKNSEHNSPTRTVQVESIAELPPLPDDLQSLVEPISPDEIRAIKQKLGAVENAVNEVQYTPVPKISSQTVSLSAGSAIPQVRIYKDVTTSITFSDVTGQPWKISAQPVNASPKTMKVTYIESSPIIFVQPLSNHVNSNVTVALEGLPTPIILNVVTATPDQNKKTVNVDYRLDLRIPKRSPSTPVRTPIPTQKIDLYSKELQAFVDGVPPDSARKVKLRNAPSNTDAWLLGDELVIRTDLYLRDEFTRTLTSIDGTHVYVLDITPEISLSDMSKTRRVSVEID